MRCMVAYGRHAPIANRWEFEFAKGSQISNSNIIQVGTIIQTKSQILKRGGRFEFKLKEGIGTFWEETLRLGIRHQSL